MEHNNSLSNTNSSNDGEIVIKQEKIDIKEEIIDNQIDNCSQSMNTDGPENNTVCHWATLNVQLRGTEENQSSVSSVNENNGPIIIKQEHVIKEENPIEEEVTIKQELLTDSIEDQINSLNQKLDYESIIIYDSDDSTDHRSVNGNEQNNEIPREVKQEENIWIVDTVGNREGNEPNINDQIILPYQSWNNEVMGIHKQNSNVNQCPTIEDEDPNCRVLYLQDLPAEFRNKKLKHILLEGIGTATKNNAHVQIIRNHGVVDALVQTDTPEECDIALQALLQKFGTRINISKDKGHVLANRHFFVCMNPSEFHPNKFRAYYAKVPLPCAPIQQKGVDIFWQLLDKRSEKKTVLGPQDNKQRIENPVPGQQMKPENPVPGPHMRPENPVPGPHNTSTSPEDGTTTQQQYKRVYARCEPPVFDTFGIKKEFLDRIGVKLPITNRIEVNNIAPQVTEEKVREVFSLAGAVTYMRVLNKGNIKRPNKAIIEYSHHVEAIQAVSMLHDRKLYGMNLKVSINTNGKYKVLPLGLESIGPGLGPDGHPLRGIHAALAIKPFREMLQKMAQSNTNNQSTSYIQTNQNSTNQDVPNMDNNHHQPIHQEQCFGMTNVAPTIITGHPPDMAQNIPNTRQNVNTNEHNIQNIPPAVENIPQSVQNIPPHIAQNGRNMVQTPPNMGQTMMNTVPSQPMPMPGQYIAPNVMQGMPNRVESVPMGQSPPVMGQNTVQNSPVMGQNMGQSTSVMGQNIGHSSPVMGQNMGQSTPVMGQSSSVMGQNIGHSSPVMGHNMGQNIGHSTPVMGHNIGQSTPVMGQSVPVMGHSTPVMGPNAPIMRPSAPNMGQNAPNMRPNAPNMGQNAPIMRPSAPNMGQNAPNMRPNAPNMGQIAPNMRPNAPNIGQNAPNMRPNAPNMGQNAPNMRPNAPNIGQNAPNMRPNAPNMGQSKPTMGPRKPTIGPSKPTMGPRKPTIGPSKPTIGHSKPNSNQSSAKSNEFIPPPRRLTKPRPLMRPNATAHLDNHVTSSDSEHSDSSHKDSKHTETKRRKAMDMVLFCNLPSSVSAEALCSKMREVGRVCFAEITGPGRALVRFEKSEEADRCIDIFDKARVDGQVISVQPY